MKKYTKITDEVTEEIAVKHLESLWGKVYCNLCIRDSTIIILDDYNDIFYTINTEQELKEDWYEEIILAEEFELWEQIACSNISKEKAIKNLERKDDKFYYTWWKTRDWKYIIEFEDWFLNTYKYIAKMPKVETVTIWGIKYNKQEYGKAIANLKPIK